MVVIKEEWIPTHIQDPLSRIQEDKKFLILNLRPGTRQVNTKQNHDGRPCGTKDPARRCPWCFREAGIPVGRHAFAGKEPSQCKRTKIECKENDDSVEHAIEIKNSEDYW